MHLERASLVNNNFLKRIAIKNKLTYYIFTDKFTKVPIIGLEEKELLGR